MTPITSETFYRAECDQPGCARTLPADDDDDGATHWPRETVIEQMAEPRGQHDETWTAVGEQTFCPRHAPGNVECAACDGRGHFRTEHPNPEPGTGKWRFTDCPVCGDRGYIVPANQPQRCRECSEGKHGACNGMALVDEGHDVLEVDCLCASGGHA